MYLLPLKKGAHMKALAQGVFFMPISFVQAQNERDTFVYGTVRE